jgi:hypothetical protein
MLKRCPSPCYCRVHRSRIQVKGCKRLIAHGISLIARLISSRYHGERKFSFSYSHGEEKARRKRKKGRNGETGKRGNGDQREWIRRKGEQEEAHGW